MSLRLRLRTDSTIPVFVQGVIPEITKRKSLSEIEKLPIRQGNQALCLAEVFDVSGNSDNQTIAWEGDLSAVHWIGAGMQLGKVIIEGNCGRHLGSRMQGGRIEVMGSVSDFVACENRGGTISIAGDAGDWVGAAYPGTKSGANGGQIFVHGNAGDAVGMAMRRGIVIVMGSTGRLAGWNMLAGTIVVNDKWGAMAGRGMKRGTLIGTCSASSEHNINQLPVSFTPGSNRRPEFLSIMENWIENNFVAIPRNDRYQQFHGDHLRGGRGEVFVGG